jgi:hypothetical protein
MFLSLCEPLSSTCEPRSSCVVHLRAARARFRAAFVRLRAVFAVLRHLAGRLRPLPGRLRAAFVRLRALARRVRPIAGRLCATFVRLRAVLVCLVRCWTIVIGVRRAAVGTVPSCSWYRDKCEVGIVKIRVRLRVGGIIRTWIEDFFLRPMLDGGINVFCKLWWCQSGPYTGNEWDTCYHAKKHERAKKTHTKKQEQHNNLLCCSCLCCILFRAILFFRYYI